MTIGVLTAIGGLVVMGHSLTAVVAGLTAAALAAVHITDILLGHGDGRHDALNVDQEEVVSDSASDGQAAHGQGDAPHDQPDEFPQ